MSVVFIKRFRVDVKNLTTVIFMTESKEIKNVALSSEDAERAIAQIVQQRRKTDEELIRNLDEGVRMLETKQLGASIDNRKFVEAEQLRCHVHL